MDEARWERIVEYEINFYLHYPKYRREIQDRLIENELNIQYPSIIFDQQLGQVYVSSLT